MVCILSGFVILFPWITFLKIRNYNESESRIFGGYAGKGIDLFLYYKEIAVILAAVLLIVWFLGEQIFQDKPDKNIPLRKGRNRGLYVSVGIFVFFSLLATVFSENKKTALYGSPTEGEGLFVLIGYAVLLLGFYNYFASDYGMKRIKWAITFLSGLTILLSLVEFWYKPILEIGWMQKLVGLGNYTDELENLGRSVTLSFYNPGYYGGFVCILLPFMLAFYLGSNTKKEMLVNGLLSAGLGFCVLCGNTTASLYVAVLEILIVCILFLIKSNYRKQKVLRMAGFLAVVISFSGIGIFIGKVDVWGIMTNGNSATGTISPEVFRIQEISIEKNRILLTGKEKSLGIFFQDGKLTFTDRENKSLNVVSKENIITFSNAGYENIRVEMVSAGEAQEEVLAKMLVDAGYKNTIDFYLLKNGTFSAVGQNGQAVGLGKASGEGLEKYYGLFTGRGYAWINSLPILKQTWIKGVGPGNFAYYFQQYDYNGLLQTHQNTKLIIDKPHSAYLQYGINIGLLGMAGFFGIFFYILKCTIKDYWKMKRTGNKRSLIQIAGIAAIIGFMFYSIVNDSMVTVTPVMCMAAGVVLAAGYKEKASDYR